MGVSSALWSACKHCAALGGAQSYAEAARVAGRRLLAARRALGAGTGHSAAGGSSFAIVLVCVDTLGPPGFACAQARQALRLGRRATWETQRLHCWRDPHNYSAYQAVQGTIHAVQHCSLTPSTRRSVKDGPAAGQTSGSQHILIRIQRVGPVRPPASLSTSRLHTPSRRRRA